jgi:uncharacterized protein (DUF2132 family)
MPPTSSEAFYFFMENENKTENQPNNPLHGVKLVDILEHLEDKFGWEEMGERLNINCFLNEPRFKSSLKFLRTTPWARDKVESMYLKSIKR